jgi:hypothetical protein
LFTVRFEHGTFKSECQRKRNRGKIKEMPVSFAILASGMQHKELNKSGTGFDDTDDYFLLVKNGCWTVYALQTNRNYILPIEYYSIQILASVFSSFSYEFHMNILNV